MRTPILAIVILLIPLSGCRDSAEQPLVGVDGTPAVNQNALQENELVRDGKPLRELSRDEQVIRNCYLVRDAAEEWSRENGGGYPSGRNSPNCAGHTLIDLIPGGDLLQNPYRPERREIPGTGSWGGKGITVYLSYLDDANRPTGYLIAGWGKGGELIQFVRNWPDSLMNVDSLVVANCREVQLAAARFASENGGVYPSDLGDETPLGNTMIDFLPGGRALRNPHTSVRTEPMDGAAATSGQTGYTSIHIGGVIAGYTITGVGRIAGVTIKTICKYPGGPQSYQPPKVIVERRNL